MAKLLPKAKLNAQSSREKKRAAENEEKIGIILQHFHNYITKRRHDIRLMHG
jgi:hypothetical protein